MTLRADRIRPILYHIVQRGLHITTRFSVWHLWARRLRHAVHSLPETLLARIRPSFLQSTKLCLCCLAWCRYLVLFCTDRNVRVYLTKNPDYQIRWFSLVLHARQALWPPTASSNLPSTQYFRSFISVECFGESLVSSSWYMIYECQLSNGNGCWLDDSNRLMMMPDWPPSYALAFTGQKNESFSVVFIVLFSSTRLFPCDLLFEPDRNSERYWVSCWKCL